MDQKYSNIKSKLEELKKIESLPNEIKTQIDLVLEELEKEASKKKKHYSLDIVVKGKILLDLFNKLIELINDFFST